MTLFADFNSSVSVPFSRFRQVLEDSGRLVEGVAGGTHFAVAQRAAGANMSVDVAAGQAWVEVDTGTRNGYGHVISDAVANVAVTASNATNPRVDQVVLQWNESSIPTGSGDVPTLAVLAGTPTAAAQVNNPTGASYRAGAAALGNDRLLLADVLVPATSTTVTTANIVDRRPSAASPGVFAAYRNGAVSLTDGSTVVFDAEEFDASNWFDIASGRFTPQVPGYYRLSWQVQAGGSLTANNFWVSHLQKNAVSIRSAPGQWQINANLICRSGHTAIVQANGTTDFFTIIINHNQGVAAAIGAALAATYFHGEFIGRS